jgi:hypothetical protein
MRLSPFSTSATTWPTVAARDDNESGAVDGLVVHEKLKSSGKAYPSVALSTTNPTWHDQASNPIQRGGKPMTNRLSTEGNIGG